jgi:succinate dehydrogenase / fumarate reductase cytochrome b subunit
MSNNNRPLSPHLGIYRWQISMSLSILHRITGMALFAGSALLVLWLWSAAYSPAFFTTLHNCLTSMPGKVCLLGWLAAFYYHLGNGIRHLFWDAGYGFSLPVMNRSGWTVVLFALLMTAATWGYAMPGGQ